MINDLLTWLLRIQIRYEGVNILNCFEQTLLLEKKGENDISAPGKSSSVYDFMKNIDPAPKLISNLALFLRLNFCFGNSFEKKNAAERRMWSFMKGAQWFSFPDININDICGHAACGRALTRASAHSTSRNVTNGYSNKSHTATDP